MTEHRNDAQHSAAHGAALGHAAAAHATSPEPRDDAAPWRSVLANVWSPTVFPEPAMTAYAGPHILMETRRGVGLMSRTAVLFLGVAGLLSSLLSLGQNSVYAFTALALLALYVHVCSARVVQVQALYLLATLLLVVCGSVFVLLVQQSGQLGTMLLLSVAMLFMLVPVVPWGLREAGFTTGAIYLMFTASIGLTRLRFSSVDLWVLQLLMLMAALVSLVLVGRALSLRKHDLTMRFGLEQAHAQVATLANRDYLTGAWNRRYLELDFDRAVAAHHAAGQPSYFALFDIDHFKLLNDTLGHRVGDDVLKAVTRAFDGLTGPDQYVVRLGGDEFALLIHGEDVIARIARALDSIGAFSSESGGQPITPGVSLGLVRLRASAGLDFDEAYKMSDELLYEAKRAGGKRIRYRLAPAVSGIPGSGEHVLRQAP